MKTGLLTSSSFFGKYIPNQTSSSKQAERVSTINLKQNFIHERPFVNCKFDIFGNRLFLLDTSGTLLNLNLLDNSFSTLKNQKIHNFTINGSNNLSVLFVNNKSELFQVGFDTKKPIKITNLNMNKIIAFEKNNLRQMLLSLDYKILFLCDVNRPGPLKIKSLKAKFDEVFTNAGFASNNRFIILTTKSSVIKIIEIMDLRTVHEIKLPFPVSNTKIQVSYDSRRVAIYGDCNIIFFINLHENQTFSYELIEVPFIKSIMSLKYTIQNDIIFLGNDQILYGISEDDQEKAVPLFNQEFQIRVMDFDISEDCSKIALVSNRTVLQIKFINGIHQQILESPTFKQLDYVKNGFEPRHKYDQPIIEDSQQNIEQGVSRKKIQNDDEEQEQQEIDQGATNQQIHVQNLINTSHQIYHQQCGPLHRAVSDLKGVDSRIKAEVNSILNNILANHKNLKNQNVPYLVDALVRLLKDYQTSAENTFKVAAFVIRSLEKQKDKIRHYGIIICPQITAIIERKFHLSFEDFCEKEILNLYGKYFEGNEWRQTVNWLLSPGVNENPDNLPLLFICILDSIYERIKINELQNNALLDALGLGLTFTQIYNKLVKLYVDEKYKNLFSKRKVETVGQKNYENESSSRLEELIQRQDQIKKALTDLKKNKGK